MKKVLSVLLSIIVACSVASAAVAETADEKGAAAIAQVIEYAFSDGDFDDLFDKDSFEIFVFDGKIMVEVSATYLIGSTLLIGHTGNSSQIGMLSTVWDMFARTSKDFTDTAVYLLVEYDGSTIFVVMPEGVIDMREKVLYNHVQR